VHYSGVEDAHIINGAKWLWAETVSAQSGARGLFGSDRQVDDRGQGCAQEAASHGATGSSNGSGVQSFLTL
jgi:hypothetical protein